MEMEHLLLKEKKCNFFLSLPGNIHYRRMDEDVFFISFIGKIIRLNSIDHHH